MNKANFDRASVIHRELNRLKLLKKDLSEGMDVFPVVIRTRIPETLQVRAIDLICDGVDEEIANLQKEFSGL